VRPLDHFDCVIMAELQVRGDLPNVELARRLGLSPAATLRRVQQLRSDGRIEGIRAVINHEKVELRVEAFVLITLTEYSEAGDAQFARALDSLPNVLRADAVTGADDVLLHIAAVDTRDLQDVLRTLPRIGARRVTHASPARSGQTTGPCPGTDQALLTRKVCAPATMADQLGQPMRPHSGSRPPYGDDVSAGRVCWPSFG
jgi:Lrp/AsnC family transcriptional regulator, leucine-responsive regulatory protein